MNEKCKNCKFFAIGVIDNNENEVSHCRRYAPRILMGCGEGWSNQKFPKVFEEDWCGEFKQKEKEN